MRPVDQPAVTAPAVRIGVAGALAAIALGAAATSVAQDQAGTPAAQPPAATQPPATTEPPAAAQPPPTGQPPTTSSQTPVTPQPVAPGQAPPSASAAATPPDAVQDCVACHGMAKDAAPSIGPNLWGVLGRKAGSTDYPYSPAMKSYGQSWTPDTLQAFIQTPGAVVPNTTMDYPGVSDPAAAKAVVDYLATLKD